MLARADLRPHRSSSVFLQHKISLSFTYATESSQLISDFLSGKSTSQLMLLDQPRLTMSYPTVVNSKTVSTDLLFSAAYQQMILFVSKSLNVRNVNGWLQWFRAQPSSFVVKVGALDKENGPMWLFVRHLFQLLQISTSRYRFISYDTKLMDMVDGIVEGRIHMFVHWNNLKDLKGKDKGTAASAVFPIGCTDSCPNNVLTFSLQGYGALTMSAHLPACTLPIFLE